MRTFIGRFILASTLSLPLACAEPEPEPDTLAELEVPYATDEGLYTVELVPEGSSAWPPSVGINKFKVKVVVGPDPGPNPDLMLDVEPPSLWPDYDLTAALPQVTPDGPDWALTLDFTAAGIWEVPVKLHGHPGEGSLNLYFKVRE